MDTRPFETHDRDGPWTSVYLPSAQVETDAEHNRPLMRLDLGSVLWSMRASARWPTALLGEWGVVVADDGYVLGTAQYSFLERFEGAGGHQVVLREDRCGADGAALEEAFGEPFSLLRRGLAGGLVRGDIADSARFSG